jgi:hypothetical protein
MTDLRVGQAEVEVLIKAVPAAREGQAAIEVLHSGVLVPVTPPSTAQQGKLPPQVS